MLKLFFNLYSLCNTDPDDPLKTTDQTRRLGLIVCIICTHITHIFINYLRLSIFYACSSGQWGFYTKVAFDIILLFVLVFWPDALLTEKLYIHAHALWSVLDIKSPNSTAKLSLKYQNMIFSFTYEVGYSILIYCYSFL